ncbi:hypothetical protein H257_16398 [Aphanomyces astaci]|uniref:Uncharacterized protein n=1 Tax=Aphanomyces astaci TaxID=112090 RepID=W4FIT4_APHAT|nr:hypothetical protein H257_16398 [Aphanomyces astaci]ETV67422.1 hypothetical protein H257_16398 [Aphanomyces astaci]|eukprot:XP_009843113.1 hypothetical protein H257_16398 [Aphanomyces astaci]
MPPITLMTHNFASLRVWFIAKLQTKRLANYLDRDGAAAQGANGFEYNELDNLRALGILTESLSESQYQYVDGALLVKTAMDNLTGIHEPIGAADRVSLLQKYHTLSWDWKNVPLEEFLGAFRDLMRRLDRAALNELPSFRVNKLLTRMPKEIRMVSHMIVDSNAEFHTVPISATKLMTEYKYLQKEGILKFTAIEGHPSKTGTRGNVLEATTSAAIVGRWDTGLVTVGDQTVVLKLAKADGGVENVSPGMPPHPPMRMP